ncbi:hypothetical protein [Maricaulis sp. MIT060901]|uniref:hypothetical protein n=1 Tax=Maricaulis sp. MIT060901 TaxID=3096993 RepID=UPI00399B8BE2
MSKLATGLISALLLGASAIAQDTLQYDGETWQVAAADNGAVRVEQALGREALYISRAQAWRRDVDLQDFVLEYEYASTDESGFIGVNWRAADENALEQFYVRPHQSGQPDAAQYLPVLNGIAGWQIYAGPNEAQATDLPAREWIRVRIVAIGDAADIFVGDMETPLLHIADLGSETSGGAIGFYMSDRFWVEGTGSWFSNISIRPVTPQDRLIGESRETDPLPDTLIGNWAVSEAFDEALLDAGYSLPELDDERTRLAVEPNGIANLSRLAGPSQGANTVLAEVTLSAEEAMTRELSFGYSDRVRLYLNGEQIFAGNAGWRVRDHRHLGTIVRVDRVPLRLQGGENVLTAAVSESFGGWGVSASLDSFDGLSIDTD